LRRLRISGCGDLEAVWAALPPGCEARAIRAAPTHTVDIGALRAAGGVYLATLGAKTRSGLRKTRREYAALGEPGLEVATDPATALAWFDGLVALHERRWEGRGAGAFSQPAVTRFHRDLIRRGTAPGFTRL